MYEESESPVGRESRRPEASRPWVTVRTVGASVGAAVGFVLGICVVGAIGGPGTYDLWLVVGGLGGAVGGGVLGYSHGRRLLSGLLDAIAMGPLP